jgi:hypothetical protein
MLSVGTNYNGDKGSTWVPQKKDAKKQWKRKDQPIELSNH